MSLGSARMWAALGAAGFTVAALTAGDTDEGPVLCLFRRCTGGYCPSCGMTRAAGQLLRGDLAASWRHHPFVLVAVVQAVVLTMVALTLRTSVRSRPGGRDGPRAAAVGAGAVLRPFHAPQWGLLAGVNVAVLVAIWLIRLSSGTIPVPFA